MASDAETTTTLSCELASDAIAHSTRRQLELVALCCFIDEVGPKNQIQTRAHYHKWLEIHLQPFENFEFVELDARHLVAVGCASYDPSSNRSLPLALLMKAGTHLYEELNNDDFQSIPVIADLQVYWDLGLAGVQLTSVGSIVGGLTLGQLKGVDFPLPDWK